MRSCPLLESRMNLRSLAWTGNEMHMMFLDFLKDPFGLCPTSSSLKVNSSGSLSFDDHVELRAENDSHFSSTSWWNPWVSMMIALARARTNPRALSDLDWLIVNQVLDSSEDVGLAGITMNSLWHPFLVVLNVYLVHLWVHIRWDSATVRRLLCAGYPRKSIVHCIFIVAVKEGVNGDGGCVLLRDLLAGPFRCCWWRLVCMKEFALISECAGTFLPLPTCLLLWSSWWRTSLTLYESLLPLLPFLSFILAS